MEWLRGVRRGALRTVVPDLAYAEAANALVQYAKHGEMDVSDVEGAVDFLLTLPLEVRSVRMLARQSLALALTRGVSAYDACFLALAIGYDAVLVTADRRLAEQAERSVLLPARRPPP